MYANIDEEESEFRSSSGQIMSPDYLATLIVNKLDKTICLIFFSITKITIGNDLINMIEHDEIHKAKFNGMVVGITSIDANYIYSNKNGQFIGTELRGVLGTLVSPIKFEIETTFDDNMIISKSKFCLIDVKSLLEYFNS